MTDAIYARYSSHAQDGGTSIEVQLDACQKAAGGKCKEYIDRARSGRSMASREALLQLLADAKTNEFTRVLVYKYDRLGRDLAETSTIIATLEDSGVEVVSVTEGKDMLARGMHLVIGEHYSRVLAERSRDGLLKRFEQRAWTGGDPPYGFGVVDGEDGMRHLAIREDEATIVREVFQTYLAESVGFKEIAKRLRARNVRARKGGPWPHNSIKLILENRSYTGRISYNQRRFKLNKKTGRRVPMFKDAKEHRSYQLESLRIISDADFDRVQQKLALRSGPNHKPAAHRVSRPFAGLVFCEKCGGVCYSRRSHNARGDYFYLSCGCRQRHGDDVCDSRAFVREDRLMGDVLKTFKTVFDDMGDVVEEATQEAQRRINEGRQEIQRVRSELASLERKIVSMTNLLIDPDIASDAKKSISRQIGEAEADRERLQTLMGELAITANENAQKLAEAIQQALREARTRLADITTPTQMKEFLAEHVGPMVLRHDGTVAQKTKSAEVGASADCRHISCIAGVGFEPTTSGL